MRSLICVLSFLFTGLVSMNLAQAVDSTPMEYRALVSRLRIRSVFQVPVPNSGDFSFKYDLRIGEPLFTLPLVSDFYLDSASSKWVRRFYDKMFLKDGATLYVAGESVPLTCVFVEGQDNRFSEKDSPLIPDVILKIYLVANDYTCTGPINPGWPSNGAKKEAWDTYVYYEVRDPTIMLPVNPRIRYRGNEFSSILIDSGLTDSGGGQ